MKRERKQLIYVALLIAGLIWGCSGIKSNQEVVTETPASSPTPFPTYSMQATYTPYPTYTPFVIALEIHQQKGQGYWPSEPLGHDYYAYVDIETDPHFRIQSFRQAYAEAVETGADWIRDPITVALRYAGYPNIDRANPSKVFSFTISCCQVVVVVVSENLMDDSIRDHEDRVDLVKSGDFWEIEWAGYRQRCYRSSFDGWITGLCP